MSTLPPPRPAAGNAVPVFPVKNRRTAGVGHRDVSPSDEDEHVPPDRSRSRTPDGPLPPTHLADLDPPGRREAVAAMGDKPFRARQLSTHYFVHHLDGRARDRMTDLPGAARDRLVDTLLPDLLTPVREVTCDEGTTVKTAWRLSDGAVVESVAMRYPDRVTVCVSTQAGCAMGCPFCATGQQGLVRNLSTAEIVDQVVATDRALDERRIPGYRDGVPDRVTNVVLMGMGEPLANYRAVVAALRRLTDPIGEGLGLSARHLTVSTVGLVPAMDRLAGERLPVTLAISLHSPDDELRDDLVPVNRRWPVASVLDAGRRYFEVTGRRVSIEYALISGVNDDIGTAGRLARILRQRGGGWVHVNAIPLNPTPGSSWEASSARRRRAFLGELRTAGVPATLRDTRGERIDGACGQLAAHDFGAPDTV
jgi:23S rRNA (adenine2503-C2)-methyltransferase